jgi:hypothetical protein
MFSKHSDSDCKFPLVDRYFFHSFLEKIYCIPFKNTPTEYAIKSASINIIKYGIEISLNSNCLLPVPREILPNIKQ